MDRLLNSARNFARKLFDEDLLDELLMEDDPEDQISRLECEKKKLENEVSKKEAELKDLRMVDQERIVLLGDLARTKEEYKDIIYKLDAQLRCVREAEESEDEIHVDCGASAELKIRCDGLLEEREELLEENERLRQEVQELKEKAKHFPPPSYDTHCLLAENEALKKKLKVLDDQVMEDEEEDGSEQGEGLEERSSGEEISFEEVKAAEEGEKKELEVTGLLRMLKMLNR